MTLILHGHFSIQSVVGVSTPRPGRQLAHAVSSYTLSPLASAGDFDRSNVAETPGTVICPVDESMSK